MKLLLSFLLVITSISGFAQKYSVEYNPSQFEAFGPFPYASALEISDFIVTDDSITFNYKTDYGTNHGIMYRPDSIFFRIGSAVKKYRPGMTRKEYSSESTFKIKSGIQESSHSIPRIHKDGKYTFGLTHGPKSISIILSIDDRGEVKFLHKEMWTMNVGRQKL